jgi:Tfp pilus assembly protein FimT
MHIHRQKPARRAPAYTLTEVLLVVAILAVMAALVAPMASSNDATKLRAAADLLAADLAYAQSESISHGDDPRLVIFDTAVHRYHVAPASDAATAITGDAGLPYIVRYGAGRAATLDGVTIDSVSLNGDDRLGFEMWGNLDQTAPATITLAFGARRITVTVDPVTGEAAIGQIE